MTQIKQFFTFIPEWIWPLLIGMIAGFIICKLCYSRKPKSNGILWTILYPDGKYADHYLEMYPEFPPETIRNHKQLTFDVKLKSAD